MLMLVKEELALQGIKHRVMPRPLLTGREGKSTDLSLEQGLEGKLKLESYFSSIFALPRFDYRLLIFSLQPASDGSSA